MASNAYLSGGQTTLRRQSRIDLKDSALYSIQGARKIISTIETRPVVNILSLSHNELEDDGCVFLFDFLCSSGRHDPIAEIRLGSNKLSNTGLLAILKYLKGNHHLRSLDLPNNAFTYDPLTAAAFAEAINTSCIETLNLASNSGLSDAFVASLLPSIQSRCLRDLNLTATGLTPASVQPFIEYFTSDRCYLHAFSCNSNRLGIAGVQAIFDALCSSQNYRLTQVSVYSNHDGVVDESVQGDFLRILSLIKIWTARNGHFNKKAQADALRLLRYSRPLLLHSSDTVNKASASANSTPCDGSCSCFPAPKDHIIPTHSSRSSPFLKLPTEIKQHILSWFAPHLSGAQRIRVFHYASTMSTLPQLLPCLPNSNSQHSLCLPDPSNLNFGNAGKIWELGGGGVGVGGGCASGKCLGSSNSLVCHRDQDRSAWLVSIRCDAYEPDEQPLISVDI